MELSPASPGHLQSVLDLVLRRGPSLTEALVSGTIRDESATEERRLLVAVEHGRLLGTGLLFRPLAAPPGLGIMNVAVERDAEGRGLGSALHAALVARPLAGATFLVGQSEADETRSLEVARHWGFEQTEVSVTSRVHLDHPVPPEVPDDVTVDVSRRLEFEDADAVDHMLDVSQTNPERDSGGAMTLDSLRGMAAEGRSTTPVALVLRVDGEPAAITLALVAGEESQVVYTGVDPRFRGRGLALLAKRLLHVQLADAGATSAVTNNAEENTGIRGVNEALGYRRTGAATFLRRSLVDADAS